jgi:hypothetical protein
MPKSRDAARFRQHIESWRTLALTLLQADYKWNQWEPQHRGWRMADHP